MKILPKSEMSIEPDSTDPNYVILGAYEHEGYRYFTKVPLRDLPNNLVSRDDLERFGIALPSREPDAVPPGDLGAAQVQDVQKSVAALEKRSADFEKLVHAFADFGTDLDDRLAALEGRVDMLIEKSIEVEAKRATKEVLAAMREGIEVTGFPKVKQFKEVSEK